MAQPLQQWILAALLATIVVAVAFLLRKLSLSGAIAAILLGTVVVGTGGWWPGVILVVFFASSSAISRGSAHPASPLDETAKGSRRDWIQVLANGWGILLGCVLLAVTDWQPWLLFGIGAIAAATADTWSSEIGRTSKTPPRLVTTWQSVPPGTSGAISMRGLFASIAGAALIALIVGIAMQTTSFLADTSVVAAMLGVTLAGVLGGLLDSLLGATLQEQRWCDVCNVRTEANPHRCGSSTRVVGGIRGFTNDVVNFMCVMCGALIGLISSIL